MIINWSFKYNCFQAYTVLYILMVWGCVYHLVRQEWKYLNSDLILLKFLPKGLINNIPALVQIMAWRHPGDKPLSESMLVCLPTHICVTQPQLFNEFPSEIRSCWKLQFVLIKMITSIQHFTHAMTAVQKCNRNLNTGHLRTEILNYPNFKFELNEKIYIVNDSRPHSWGNSLFGSLSQ